MFSFQLVADEVRSLRLINLKNSEKNVQPESAEAILQ
jgi:hypothetical protein